MLAGCGASQPPIGVPGAMPQSSALAARTNSTNYKVVHSFRGYPDGRLPLAGLMDVGGRLYGTTHWGGTNSDCKVYPLGNYGCGTVFSVASGGGKEKVLYRFGVGTSGRGSGSLPAAGLIAVGGVLYGTTATGGSYSGCTSSNYAGWCGTVFSITPSGTEKMLHSFGSGSDGSYPVASLIDVKGTLYGTTSEGGAYSGGTVFSITTGGTENVVHSFNGTDGSWPCAGLIDVKGVLYGTTSEGGAYNDGTVFSITTDGYETVLHSFGQGTDGKDPIAGLIDVHGTLYGTTYGGGTYEYGAVFSISLSGTEKIVHNFGNGSDGEEPEASLIGVNGKLYGTTALGGRHGRGTIFALSP